jgi:hypothetical protein
MMPISVVDYKELEKKVAEGLDFIIYHLKEPIWPRTISTKTTEGRQIPIHSKQEALAWYKAANFLDCRISAYPCDYANGKISNRQTIDLDMVDIDQSNFRSRQALDTAESKTLTKIEDTFGVDYTPSELWSGNGYHIIIPIESRYILEDTAQFSKYEEPSKKFLRFAEWYLSNGKADSNHFHNVSFGNCMLRIPSSHNSKCVQRNYDKADFTTQVKIIHKWNGYRPPSYLLIGSFLSYLVDQKLKEIKRQRQFSKYRHEDNNKPSIKTTTIPWIETLLQTALSDHRKYCIWRILVPYLINVRRVSSYEESYSVIKNWLDKCNKLQRLNFNAKIKINEGLRGASKGYLPISLEKLSQENKALYAVVCNQN